MPIFTTPARRQIHVAPVVGQEQPVSITTATSTAWTEVDVSAAFSSTAIKKGIIALVVQGCDHDEESTPAFTEMRFRMAGSGLAWEDADGVSGFGNFIYREGTDYAGGGVAEVVEIPVSTAGKFDYWVKNHAYPPRSIVRILSCVTEAFIPPPTILYPKIAKVDSDTEDFPRLNLLQGTDAETYVLEFDEDASQKAHWEMFMGTYGISSLWARIAWTTQGGVVGQKVRWDVSVGGSVNNEAWDVALITNSISDAMLATGKTHVALIQMPGEESEFTGNTISHIQIMRDHDHADDNLAAKAQLIRALIEPLKI